MTSTHRWILGVGGGLAVLAIAAVSNPPKRDPRWQNADATPVTVDAYDLWSAYDRNEVSAAANYNGELLRVRGTIDSIGIDRDGIPYVDFGLSLGAVRANFTNGGTQYLQRLSKGELVTVVCVGVGKSTIVVHMKDCRLDANDAVRRPKLK